MGKKEKPSAIIMTDGKREIIRKRQKDISGIDRKIISMYGRGLSTRQI